MSKSNVVSIDRSESREDALTEVLRRGSRRLLREAIEAEVESFLAEYRGEVTEDGRRRMVRNGYLREREIQTGIGGVAVKVPRVRDRSGSLQFRSKIAPPYLRRAKSVEELLPWLYLRGISTGDFSDAPRGRCPRGRCRTIPGRVHHLLGGGAQARLAWV